MHQYQPNCFSTEYFQWTVLAKTFFLLVVLLEKGDGEGGGVEFSPSRKFNSLSPFLSFSFREISFFWYFIEKHPLWNLYGIKKKEKKPHHTFLNTLGTFAPPPLQRFWEVGPLFYMIYSATSPLAKSNHFFFIHIFPKIINFLKCFGSISRLFMKGISLQSLNKVHENKFHGWFFVFKHLPCTHHFC